MSFYVEGRVEFTPDPALWKEFTQSPTGTVGSDLRRRGRKLQALAIASAGKRTGRLASSISMSYSATINPSVTIGSNVHYAFWVHEGTRPHLIDPTGRQTMRFKVRGRVVYAQRVFNPGTKGTKYLSRHLRKVVND